MAKSTKVREVMTADPVVIGPEGTVGDAWQIMVTQGYRHIPVVENGRLLGILSSTDVGRLGATSPPILALVIRVAMALDPTTVDPDEFIEVAAAKMAVKKVNCLLVVEEEKLVGIVTTYDLLDALARKLRAEE